MAFEPFPKDTMDSFRDPGPFYVRENGKLTSPPGMKPKFSPPNKRLCMDLLDDSPDRLLPCEITKTSKDKHSAPKLFDLCVRFIAENIILLESLVDFPEVVGRSLFQAALTLGTFDDLCGTSVERLQIFLDAYGHTVLEELRLRYEHSMARTLLEEHTLVLQHVTRMDLSGCALGGREDALRELSQLTSLTHLSLQDNVLTDEEIQRFTTPVRLMKRGLINLKVLDLSGNSDIGDLSARYLTGFQKLEALDLSGTSFTEKGILKLCAGLCVDEVDSLDQIPAEGICCTTGWAAPLVTTWLLKAEEARHAERSTSKDLSGALKFYGQKQKRKTPLLPQTQIRHVEPTSHHPKILLKRTELDLGGICDRWSARWSAPSKAFKCSEVKSEHSRYDENTMTKKPKFTKEEIIDKVTDTRKPKCIKRNVNQTVGLPKEGIQPNSDDMELMYSYLNGGNTSVQTSSLWTAMGSQKW